MQKITIALVLAVATGYISLSQEILWIRVLSYTTGSAPEVFGHVLGFFLVGIAFGALVGKWLSKDMNANVLLVIGTMLAISGTFYFFAVPINSLILTLSGKLGIMTFYLSISLAALMIGGVFPMLCHVGITGQKEVGQKLSWMYLANILGAVTGPVLTGFVLLDVMSLEDNIKYLSFATLILSAIIFWFSPWAISKRFTALASVAVILLTMELSHEAIYANTFEKLQFKSNYVSENRFKFLVQNRSGVISVSEDDDTLYGGGIYDGKFNLDPILNNNGILRAYMISGLHRDPKAILDIGLASGSWARVLAGYEPVQNMTIIEINKGYPAIVENYPEIATVLKEPHVNLVYDDGRRWLNRNPDAKFDFILMNTTYHWRSNSTNLLSSEFLTLVRSHLNPGGVVYYNATGSMDVLYTAKAVFKHAVVYDSFVAASDSNFDLTMEERSTNIQKFRSVDNKLVFDLKDRNLSKIAETLASENFVNTPELFADIKGLKVITDDNMVPEFKSTIRRQFLFNVDKHRSWKNLFESVSW